MPLEDLKQQVICLNSPLKKKITLVTLCYTDCGDWKIISETVVVTQVSEASEEQKGDRIGGQANGTSQWFGAETCRR